MAEFLITNMAPIMFSALMLFLLIGYPVAFSLAAVGMAFGLLGIHLGLLTPNLLQAFPDRVFGIMKNEILLAIPFFTFMGLVLERSGMAEALLDTIGQLFGSIRGGLAYAVIFVGALLAATTGVVAASVIAMGLISLPIMLRYGYDKPLACGVIAASGTLAQIIPPSLVLIVMADVLGRSVGDMYKGAILPGLILGQVAPALPLEARTLHGWALAQRVVVAMVPPLVLIFLVLGTIFIGWATPTEGGAMGAVGALLLAFSKGKSENAHGVHAFHRQNRQFRHLHPDRRQRVQPGVSRREWRSVGGASTHRSARRSVGFSDRRQYSGVPVGVLPGFFRNQFHHPAPAGASGGETGH